MLVFIKNIDKESCESIKQLIGISDKLGMKLGYDVDFSYDAKILIVGDMVDRGILVKGKRGLTQPISLNPTIRGYILESLSQSYIIHKE